MLKNQAWRKPAETKLRLEVTENRHAAIVEENWP